MLNFSKGSTLSVVTGEELIIFQGNLQPNLQLEGVFSPFLCTL